MDSEINFKIPQKSHNLNLFVNPTLKEKHVKLWKHSADNEESSSDGKKFKENPGKGSKSLEKERASIILALRELKNRHCPDDCSRLMVLEERDKLLYKLKAIADKSPQPAGEKQMNATLNSMCTEKERYSRTLQKRISIFECSKEGKLCPSKMIKEYSRSAADQEKPLPHELRRPDVLHYTMQHLLTNVLDILPEFEEQGQWYSFLWDRTRAIRKEITQIMLSNQLAASLLECCTRFHILCSYLLCAQAVESFDQKMNTEHLVKCLQTLRHLYDDLAKQGIFCANEAEFRAFDVLLHLHDNNVLRQVLSYRKEIREDPIVRHAIQLACAMQTNNFSRFFRLLRAKSSYLQCCICHRFFIQVRRKAIDTLNCAIPRDSTGNKTLHLEYLIKLLAFDDKANALQFLEEFGIRQNVAEEDVIVGWNKLNMDCDPKFTTYMWIDEKRRCNLSEIVYGGLLEKLNILPEIDDSFDENGYYSKDPVLENIFTNVSMSWRRELEEKQRADIERQRQLQQLQEHQLQIKKIQEEEERVQKEEERVRIDIKRRGNAILQNIYTKIQEQAVSHLLKGVVIDEINRFKTQQKHFREIAQSLSNNLLESVIDKQVKSIAKCMLNTRIKEVEEGLSLHKQRFSNLWIKQFWDQWRCKVVLRKEARKRRSSAWEEFKPNWSASLFSPDRYLSNSILSSNTSTYSQFLLTTKQRLSLAQLRRSRALRITKNIFEHWKQFTKRKMREKAQAEIINLTHLKRPFSLRRSHPIESCDYSNFIRDNSPARKSVRLTLEESLNFPTVPTWMNRSNTLVDDSFVPNLLEESVVTEKDVSIFRSELKHTTSFSTPRSHEKSHLWDALEETETALEETKLETTELIDECRQSQKRSNDLKKKAAILAESLQKHQVFMSQLKEDVLRKRQTN